MGKFILKVTSFSLLVILFVVWVFAMADGRTDPYYIRFTTSKQHSMILGDSRAAQGLQPDVVSKTLGQTVYNYAFTLGHSPWGPSYFNSIRRKLRPVPDTTGIFILAVSPWLISSKSADPNDSTLFREVGLCVDNMTEVDAYPNYEYLVKNTLGRYDRILWPQNKYTFLHNNGWLEVSPPMDSLNRKKRLEKKIRRYSTDHLPGYTFSSLRLQYLEKTVAYLKQYGQVYLVRLPMRPEIMEIEQQYMANFERKIQGAIGKADGYYDFTPRNAEYTYTDGNHLYKTSGREVSRELAEWIDSLRSN